MKIAFQLMITILLCASSFGQVPITDAEITKLSKHPINKIQANDLEYYYIEKGEGETIFFLHGFPDLASTWDIAIDEFSKNYRCIAPFLRGYYPTAIPTDGDYSIKTIAQDIDAIAQKLGIEEYIVVGQDWGASVTYSLANLYPEKVQKIVTVAIPHYSFIKANFRTLYKARHFVRFRSPKSALDYTRKKNFAYIDKLYQRWSPNWKDYSEASDLIKSTFQKEGRLEASLGYYWSFFGARKDKELAAFNAKIPTMPHLAMAGKKDGSLVVKAFYKMEAALKPNTKLLVHETAGHFLHREEPAYFIQSVSDFLKAVD